MSDSSRSAAYDAQHIKGLLRSAIELDKRGDLSQAASAYRQVVLSDPNNTQALQRYCNLVGPRDPASAQTLLRELLARPNLTAPSISTYLRYLMLYTEILGRMQAGLDLMFADSLADYGVRFAQAEYAAWVAHGERWYAQKPHRYDAAYHLVAARLASGNLSGIPVAAIDTARQDPGNRIADTFELDPAFYARLEAQTPDEILSALAPARIHAQTTHDFSRAVMVGCDQLYFERYGIALVRSFAAVRTRATGEDGIGLHVHVFNADETALRRLFDELTGAHPGLHLRFSVEHADVSAAEMPGYAHAMRFARTLQFAPLYEGGMWQIDADMLFNGGPAPMFDKLTGHDVALWLMPGRYSEPHNRIAAGIVGFAPTPAGQGYLKCVAGYLTHLWRHRRIRWGADQVALWMGAVSPRQNINESMTISALNKTHYGHQSRASILSNGKT